MSLQEASEVRKARLLALRKRREDGMGGNGYVLNNARSFITLHIFPKEVRYY